MITPSRIKEKIKAVFRRQSEQEDYETALDQISEDLANAICQEILELVVTVPAGIKVTTTGTATAQTGATTEIKIAELS